MQKNEEKWIKYTSDSDSTSGLLKCKVMKPLIYEELDRTILEWFKQQGAQGTLVSGIIC
jgi:hypothetical protein